MLSATSAHGQTSPTLMTPATPATTPLPKAKGSFQPGVHLQDITYTLRMQYFRSLTISRHDPNVAYVASYDGYVFKTVDGGQTWDESRLIVQRRGFFGDHGQRLYFGVHRRPGGSRIRGEPSIYLKLRGRHGKNLEGRASRATQTKTRKRSFQAKGVRALGFRTIDPFRAGRAGAATNVNFGIGLPGGAPRLQNFVRKWGKPTAGLNIKQTLLLRGFLPTEVRIIVEHPTNPKIVFACTMYGLFMTYDGGLNWVRTFQGVDWRGRRIFHAAVDPQDPKKVFLATGNGLYISKDGGENYLKATQQGVGGGVIDWIYFNPHDSRYVFVGTDYGLLRSKDGGENFEWIYFTTFPAARIVRYITIDPFDKKTGYIATHDGLFKTPNILTGSLEDWKRVGGLRFTGMETTKVSLDPKQRGHLWAMTNMKVPSPISKGLRDTGGAFIWESVDGGVNWRVIFAGQTLGSIQWYASDPNDPSLLWICWSRALHRMKRRVGKVEERGLSAAQMRMVDELINRRMPTVGDLKIAAMRYAGVELGQVLDYRQRSRLKALVPHLQLSLTMLQANLYNVEADALYPTLPFRHRNGMTFASTEWRAMLMWDLAPLVFNLDTTLFGRIERMNYEVRSEIWITMLRLYSELRRLRLRMITKPPKSARVRLFYKLRIEELESYIDFITGGYLTRYRRGDKPSPWKAPWFERWEGTGKDFAPKRIPLFGSTLPGGTK
ncbi:MAG: hypothetical protein CSA65_03395 [Proteobacteria bacterium]|nr:MAG: hypothetical protein CSA65_03395 [Pseudomonadota bacterium]